MTVRLDHLLIGQVAPLGDRGVPNGIDKHCVDGRLVLMKMGLQMSQRARAIEAWAVIASKGRTGIAEMTDRCCELAQHMASRLVEGGAELLAPVGLNQMLFAFGSNDQTRVVIDAVKRDGTCWVGGTNWMGRHAMRISLCDSSTTQADVDASATAIIKHYHNQD